VQYMYFKNLFGFKSACDISFWGKLHHQAIEHFLSSIVLAMMVVLN